MSERIANPEASNMEAATGGFMVGIIGGVGAVLVYRSDLGVNQYNQLSLEISSTQPHVQQWQSLVHSAEIAPLSNKETHAALPYLKAKLETAEAPLHALIAKRDHYHPENNLLEAGILASAAITGTVLALAARNVFYAIKHGVARRKNNQLLPPLPDK